MKDDAQTLKLYIRILDSMSEDQLEHPEKIKAPQREKIALKAETVILFSFIISFFSLFIYVFF